MKLINKEQVSHINIFKEREGKKEYVKLILDTKPE